LSGYFGVPCIAMPWDLSANTAKLNEHKEINKIVRATIFFTKHFYQLNKVF